MKVIHCVHNYHGFSGASKQAKSISAALFKSFGLKPIFFSIGEKTKEDKDGNNLVITSKRGVLARAFHFTQVILRHRPDIIHFHGADFALLIVAKLFGVKTYWKSTLCGSDDFETLSSGSFGSIKKYLFGLIDCNNTLTIQMKTINKHFINSNKMVTIPNGVDIPKEMPTNKQRLALIVSAIIPRKGVIDGIEFFNEHLRNKGYKLVILGPCKNTLDGFSQPYKEAFLGALDDSVSYLGEVDFDTVKSYLKKSHFLIHLSKSEGMPNIVLEAQAYGVYPITLDMDGLASELYENGTSGYCVESKNIQGPFETLDASNILGYERVNKLNHFDVVSMQTYKVYSQLVNVS